MQDGQQLRGFRMSVMNCTEYQHRLDIHIKELGTTKEGFANQTQKQINSSYLLDT